MFELTKDIDVELFTHGDVVREGKLAVNIGILLKVSGIGGLDGGIAKFVYYGSWVITELIKMNYVKNCRFLGTA